MHTDAREGARMIERRSARFILIDPENWVQLFRVHELVVNDPFRTLFSRTVWFSGGGADQTAPFRRRSTVVGAHGMRPIRPTTPLGDPYQVVCGRAHGMRPYESGPLTKLSGRQVSDPRSARARSQVLDHAGRWS
jgi:hypothetical protein